MKSLTFESGHAAEFKKDENDGTCRFRMLGYSGKPMRTPYGKIVINLAKMTPRSAVTPAFQHHDRRLIVGHSDKLEIGDSVTMQGIVSGTGEAAKEVMETSAKGFPWQASVGVDIFEYSDLKEGAKRKVNGMDIEGPALILEQTELTEISFVPLGMDQNTNAVAFSQDMENELSALFSAPAATTQPKEAENMADETNKAEFEAAAKKEASERMMALCKAFPNDIEFAQDAFARGLSLESAKAEYFDKHVQKQLADKDAKISELEAQKTSKPGIGEADPVDFQEAPSGALNFEAEVDKIQSAKGCSRQDAINQFCFNNPKMADKALGLEIQE